MDERKHYHSVVLDSEKCTGCTNCMQRCPMEAIRVRNGKAIIIKERCIDCGECIVVCPYHAQGASTDNIEEIKDYKVKIAIPAVSLHGQFSRNIKRKNIFEAIKELGFDMVYDEAIACRLSSIAIKKLIQEKKLPKPVIGSACAAVLRLIKDKYPMLLDHIIPLESPMEIAARLARLEAMKKYNVLDEDISVTYIASCPARVTSVHEPMGLEKSAITNVISFKKLYGDLLKNIKGHKSDESEDVDKNCGIQWATIGGQSKLSGLMNYIAVDGINNVIKVLDQIEVGTLDNVDYIEAMACIGGCVGGPLNIENSFVAENRIRNLLEKMPLQPKVDSKKIMDLYDSGLITWDVGKEWEDNSKKEEFGIMIERLQKTEEILKKLPGLNCGSCGAPSCKALAEDIVNGHASIKDCLILEKGDKK